MDELQKAALTNAMKDISDLKDRVKELENKTPAKKNWNVDPKKPATQAQLDAVAIRGGEIWDKMTHQDITDQFNKIDKRKSEAPKDPEKRIESPEIEAAIKEGSKNLIKNQSENKEGSKDNSELPDY